MRKYEKILFHIGIHKTGTTFLQKCVFPKLKNIHFGRWKIEVENIICGSERYMVISNESLSGRPWGIENEGHMTIEEKKYRGEKIEGERDTWIDDFENKIEGISKSFPNAEVAICFRRQDELLNSLYKQYILEGGTGNTEALFSFNPKKGLLGEKDLRFMERIKIIESKLKKEPYVFTYDSLKKDYKKCIKSMLNYFNLPIDGVDDVEEKRENESKGEKRYEIIKILNKAKNREGILGRIAQNERIDRMKYKLLRYPIMEFENKRSIEKRTKKEVRKEYRSDWESVEKYSKRQN